MYVRYVRNQVFVWSGDHRIGQKRLVFISTGFYRVKVIAKL